jgi:hypothetical protein
LKSRLDQLTATARADGRTTALAHLQSLFGGGVVRRGPGRPKGNRNKPKALAAEPKRRPKNAWAGLSRQRGSSASTRSARPKALPQRSE